MGEMDLFELHKERLIKDGVDITNGLFGLSEVNEKMMLHAKVFAEYIIKDGLLDESLGNVGTVTGDGILGFAKIFEDPKDGDGVALDVVTVDEMYEKFIGR